MAAATQVVQIVEDGKPREEPVRERAYELFLHRGAIHGFSLQDWLQAKGEIPMENDSVSNEAKKN